MTATVFQCEVGNARRVKLALLFESQRKQRKTSPLAFVLMGELGGRKHPFNFERPRGTVGTG